ncbi:hypothetical protein, partial [Pseudomonas helleri]|uniref:hypothetical protein n=1 Tax=Pseudomonas helleri TaxID=1608996 RepID=UPI001E40A1AC
ALSNEGPVKRGRSGPDFSMGGDAMSVSEQELFGLMAVAQEQQKAAVVAIERLEAQRAGLEHTVEQARAAVREMEMAGKASPLIIEKATRIAVSEAVSSALVAVRDETVKTL